MRGKRKAAVLMTMVLLLGLATVTVQATEETRQQINQAEQEKKDTESKLDETEDRLEGLNEQKDSLQGTLTTLNTELSQVKSPKTIFYKLSWSRYFYHSNKKATKTHEYWGCASVPPLTQQAPYSPSPCSSPQIFSSSMNNTLTCGPYTYSHYSIRSTFTHLYVSM